LGWFKTGRILKNKREEKKMKQGVFWEKNRKIGGTCGRKPQILF
jgi:hypothetical protein